MPTMIDSSLTSSDATYVMVPSSSSNNSSKTAKSKATTSSRDNADSSTRSSATSTPEAPTMVRRIRNPNPNDVLSGRGGGINAHPGNIQFREWVRVRKDAYTLTESKVEKARVAREVISLVQSQSPPGRFLQRDPTASGPISGGGWIELDEERMMAKTSQALREGAPAIRASKAPTTRSPFSNTMNHSKATGTGATTSPVVVSKGINPRGIRATTATPLLENVPVGGSKRGYADMMSASGSHSNDSRRLPPTVPNAEQALAELRANAEQAAATSIESTSPTPVYSDESETDLMVHTTPSSLGSKRVRVEYQGQTVYPADATPPLQALAPPILSPESLSLSDHHDSQRGQTGSTEDDSEHLDQLLLPLQPVGNQRGLKRSHSLALTDDSDWSPPSSDEEFVNPFENDDDDFLQWETQAQQNSLRDNFMMHSPSFVPPPRMGLHRDVSTASNGDMGGIGALMRTNESSSSSSSTSNHSQVNNNTNSRPSEGDVYQPHMNSSNNSHSNYHHQNNNSTFTVGKCVPHTKFMRHVNQQQHHHQQSHDDWDEPLTALAWSLEPKPVSP